VGDRPLVRISTATQATGEMTAKLDAILSEGASEVLHVSVGTNEINTGELSVDHIVDRIAPPASHADHCEAFR
jgi:hypothetical protein